MMREKKLDYVVSRNTAISTAAVWLGVAAAVVVVTVPWLPYFGTLISCTGRRSSAI